MLSSFFESCQVPSNMVSILVEIYFLAFATLLSFPPVLCWASIGKLFCWPLFWHGIAMLWLHRKYNLSTVAVLCNCKSKKTGTVYRVLAVWWAIQVFCMLWLLPSALHNVNQIPNWLGDCQVRKILCKHSNGKWLYGFRFYTGLSVYTGVSSVCLSSVCMAFIMGVYVLYWYIGAVCGL